MTDPNRTHLAFLLDRSGSMQSIKTDTEGGFDAFIAEQRTQPGVCTVTLAQFDTEYEVNYQDLPIADVPPLNLEPRGMCIAHQIGRLAEPSERTARDHHRLIRSDAIGIGGDHFQPRG